MGILFWAKCICLAFVFHCGTQVSSDGRAIQEPSGVILLPVIPCDPSNFGCSELAAVLQPRSGPFLKGTTVNFKILEIVGLSEDQTNSSHCRLDKQPTGTTIIGSFFSIPPTGLGDNMFTLLADEPGGIVLHCEVSLSVPF